MSTRQNKVSKQVQKDIAGIIQEHGSDIVPGKMLTVTGVRISPDLGVAKIYISVFPSAEGKKDINLLNGNKNLFRNSLGRKLRHQLKKVPEIIFYLDDSLDYIDNINNLLKD
ncbi:MAG: 30S ribosome-binding factor RbfA [Bacteroidales bacterium]|jgi:ribosome-binding factor A